MNTHSQTRFAMRHGSASKCEWNAACRGVRVAMNATQMELSMSQSRTGSASGARTTRRLQNSEVHTNVIGCCRSSLRLSRPAARCRNSHDERMLFETLVIVGALRRRMRVEVRSCASTTFLDFVLDRCMLAQTTCRDCFILVHFARRWLAEKGEANGFEGDDMPVFEAPISRGDGRFANAKTESFAASFAG